MLQRATEEEIGIALEIANRAAIMMFRRNKTNVELSLTFSKTDKNDSSPKVKPEIKFMVDKTSVCQNNCELIPFPVLL